MFRFMKEIHGQILSTWKKMVTVRYNYVILWLDNLS